MFTNNVLCIYTKTKDRKCSLSVPSSIVSVVSSPLSAFSVIIRTISGSYSSLRLLMMAVVILLASSCCRAWWWSLMIWHIFFLKVATASWYRALRLWLRFLVRSELKRER